MMGARQLKVGLRVADLDRSCALYLRLGFRQIPGAEQPNPPVTLEPEDVGWARIFYGLDPDGYEVMFEEFKTAAPDGR